MQVELQDYAKKTGIKDVTIRQRIFIANDKQRPVSPPLPGVTKMQKIGGTWVFTVDKRKFKKYLEI